VGQESVQTWLIAYAKRVIYCFSRRENRCDVGADQDQVCAIGVRGVVLATLALSKIFAFVSKGRGLKYQFLILTT
jgi:hypothetical protein